MSKTSTIGSAKSSMKRKNSIWHALPYIAPHFIIFAVFGIIPIIFGIGLAFTRWNMVGAPKFVGCRTSRRSSTPAPISTRSSGVISATLCSSCWSACR